MDLPRLDTAGVLRAGRGWELGQGRARGRGESGAPLGLCRRPFLGKRLPGVQTAASPRVSPRAPARHGTTRQADAQRECMWIHSPPPKSTLRPWGHLTVLTCFLLCTCKPPPAPQHTPLRTAGACPKKANQSTEKLRNPEGECARHSLSSLRFWLSWHNEVMVVQATAPLKGDTL